MKLYIRLIFILILAVSVPLSAQTVSGTFIGVSPQKVYLNAYTGLFMETVDSVMMGRDGSIVFNLPLTKGMYQIETETGLEFDFLYDNNPVSFTLQDSDNLNTLQFLRSEANSDWLQYKNIKRRTVHSQDLLKVILREYDKNTDYYRRTVQEYESLQNDFRSFTDKLLASHDNYATTLIRVDRPPLLNLDDSFDKQREDLIMHYFDDTDFGDTTLIPSNVLTTKIIDFISLSQRPEQSPKQMQMAMIFSVDKVLKSATVDYTMYKFVIEFLMDGFNKLGFFDIVDYMSRLPYSNGVEMSDLQMFELANTVESFSRVRIGETAPQIQGETIDGKTFSLNDISSEYTIVFFWSVTCEHCLEIIGDLSEFLAEHLDYTLISVSVVGDAGKIKKLVRKEKLKGYFYCDGLKWSSPVVEDYAVSSTPSIFLLNKDKKIILKPFDFAELKYFVDGE